MTVWVNQLSPMSTRANPMSMLAHLGLFIRMPFFVFPVSWLPPLCVYRRATCVSGNCRCYLCGVATQMCDMQRVDR